MVKEFSLQETHYRMHSLHVSSRLLGPVDPSFRALAGRFQFTVRRHKFNEDSLSSETSEGFRFRFRFRVEELAVRVQVLGVGLGLRAEG